MGEGGSMKITPPINSFNAGELSPMLDCRYDLEKYRSGCKTLQNAIPLVEGGAKKMPGTYYVAPAKVVEGADAVRLVPFSFNTEQSYVLEFGHNYIRVFADSGQVVGPVAGSDYSNATLYAEDDLVWVGYYWKVDFGSLKKLFISMPYGGFLSSQFRTLTVGVNSSDDLSVTRIGAPPYTGISILLANSTSAKNTAALIEDGIQALGLVGGTAVAAWQVTENAAYAAARPILGANSVEKVTTATGVYKALQANQYNYFPAEEYDHWELSETTEDIVEIATTYHWQDLFELDVSTQSADVLYIFHADYAPMKLQRYSHTDWTLSELSCIGTPDVAKSGYGGLAKIISDITQANPAAVVCASHGFQTGDEVYINGALGMIEVNQLRTTVTVVDANNFTLDGINSTNYITYEGGAYAVAIVDMFAASGDYPACGTFYEQRLIVGGSDNYPLRVYGSVQGDYENFICDPEAEDYAIQYDLVSRKIDRIRWMLGKEQLMIGTASGIIEMSGSADASLSQTNVKTRNSITIGVGQVAPQQINDSIIWVTRYGGIVRLLQYIWQNDQWVGPDLTRLARHIAQGDTAALSGIKQTAFQAEPYPILWAVRNDGILIGLTFESQEQVYAWFTILTDGFVDSVAVISRDNDEDQVWICVERTINGSDVRYIEYFMPQNIYGEIEDAFFVHSGLTYDSTATSTITGLDHLEGEEVAVLADGEVQSSKTVASGQITLDSAASKVHVGLSYDTIIEPMNPIAGSNQGTPKGKKQKINRLTMAFNESAGGRFGVDQTHLHDIPFEDETVLYSGDITVDLDGNWSEDATIAIVHSDPLPFTLKCIVPHISSNEP
jgi:hypothetical protein